MYKFLIDYIFIILLKFVQRSFAIDFYMFVAIIIYYFIEFINLNSSDFIKWNLRQPFVCPIGCSYHEGVRKFGIGPTDPRACGYSCHRAS